MKDLLFEELLDARNVKSFTYDKENDYWTLQFYKGEPTTHVPTENLLDFLQNA